MNIQERKRKFIDRELWSLVISGGLNRSGTYTSQDVPDSQRDEFRKRLRQRFDGLVSNSYKHGISGEDHVSNLLQIREEVSEEFSGILKGGRIRLGIVQKLLNLYLKYQWVLGKIPEPPHCPFDRIVIQKLRSNIKWTEMDCPEEYRKLVNAAESVKKPEESIAAWELRVWGKSNP